MVFHAKYQAEQEPLFWAAIQLHKLLDARLESYGSSVLFGFNLRLTSAWCLANIFGQAGQKAIIKTKLKKLIGAKAFCV